MAEDESLVRIVSWPAEPARVEHRMQFEEPCPVSVSFEQTPATVVVQTAPERPLDVPGRGAAVSGSASRNQDQPGSPGPQAEPSSAAGGGGQRAGRRKRRRKRKGTRSTASPTRLQGLTEDASRIVQQAASILEEEIAAGIIAARQVEDRFIDGQRIPAPSLRFTPASLTLDPRSVQQVDLALDIPADSPPGSYSGLVQAGGLDQVKAVLVVEVG